MNKQIANNNCLLKEGKPLSQEWIQYAVNFYQKYGKIPGNKILCNRTHTFVTCLNPWLSKQVQKYGGIYEFLTRYERTKGKKNASKSNLRKKQKSVSTRKGNSSRYATQNLQIQLPNIKQFRNAESISPLEFEEISRNAGCFRPDLFLEQYTCPNHCPYYQNCRAACRSAYIGRRKKIITTLN